MRKSKAEAAKTRRRVLKTAATEFRRNGISTTGLNEIMAAAGLTHGGFYRHFDSKDQLVAEVCVTTMDEIVAAVTSKRSKGRKRPFAANYLSAKHRDSAAAGCPFAALGSELARCDKSVQEAATIGFLKLVDLLAEEYSPGEPESGRPQALATAASMIGAVTMARMVSDAKLSNAILCETKKRIIDG